MQPIHAFQRAARRTPRAIAAEDTLGETSFGALAARVDALAAGLQALDPTPGSRVGICGGNSAEHLAVWLAVLAAGKVWVPLFPKLGADSLRAALDATEASILVTEDAWAPLFDGVAAQRMIADPASTAADATGGLAASRAGKRPEEHIRAPYDPQAIKFTGGTTGAPKGVMQPLRAWNACAATQLAVWRPEPEDAFLAAAPMTHGTSTQLLPWLAAGARIVLLNQPRPEETLAALGSGRIGATFLPPTAIHTMLERDATGLDFSRLKQIIYAGGPIRAETMRAAQARFGPRIAVSYGQTEAPQIATAALGPELTEPGRETAVGRPTILTDVAVFGADGRALPPGEIGEVRLRGDLVMTGYWRQPEKTAETIVDGWLRTGDLGTFDEAGYLHLKGRSRDVIISGGFNVYPGDVEPAIMACAGVADVAVLGVPDPKWGEAVHAAVVRAPGAGTRAEDVIAAARARVGPVRAPKGVTFVDVLPRNAYGKLQKACLAEMVEAARRKENG
jgi:acyl-CoA synthetase (AMP-forming)/AMP-acid ligase II